MLMLAEIVDRIGACGVISKLDLTKGYYQVRMKEEDQPKTAFCSPYGKFQFTCVPFGLKNATAFFRRLMDIKVGGASKVSRIMKNCYCKVLFA